MKILLIGMDGMKLEFLIGEDPVSEQLTNFHRLMEVGCFGHLEIPETQDESSLTLMTSSSIQDDFYRIVSSVPSELVEIEAVRDWDLLKKKIIAHSRDRFEQVISILKTSDWNYLQYIDAGLDYYSSASRRIWGEVSSSEENYSPFMTGLREYYLHLNEQLGGLFEHIDEDLVFLVISHHGDKPNDPGFFILASSNNPLQGEIVGVKLNDIGPTLFELAGYSIPDVDKGKSLVAGKMTEPSPEQLSKEEEDILRERLSGLGYI